MWRIYGTIENYTGLFMQINATIKAWRKKVQNDDADDKLYFIPGVQLTDLGQTVIENLSLKVEHDNVVYVNCKIISGNGWQVQIGRKIYDSKSDMNLLADELAQLCNNCDLGLLISYYGFVNTLLRTLADLGGIGWYDMESTKKCLTTLALANHPRLGAEASALKKIFEDQALLKRIGLFACAIHQAHHLKLFNEFVTELSTINQELLNCPDFPAKLKDKLTAGIRRCLFVMRYNALGQNCPRSGVIETPVAEQILTFQYFRAKIEADSDFASRFISKTFNPRYYSLDVQITGNMKDADMLADMLVSICNRVLGNCADASLPIWRFILAGERNLLLDFVQHNKEVFETYLAERNTYNIALFHQIFISLGPDLSDLTFLFEYCINYPNITSVVNGRDAHSCDIAKQLDTRFAFYSPKNPSQHQLNRMLGMSQILQLEHIHNQSIPIRSAIITALRGMLSKISPEMLMPMPMQIRIERIATCFLNLINSMHFTPEERQRLVQDYSSRIKQSSNTTANSGIYSRTQEYNLLVTFQEWINMPQIATSLLRNQPVGSYLLRLSENLNFCATISWRAQDDEKNHHPVFNNVRIICNNSDSTSCIPQLSSNVGPQKNISEYLTALSKKCGALRNNVSQQCQLSQLLPNERELLLENAYLSIVRVLNFLNCPNGLSVLTGQAQTAHSYSLDTVLGAVDRILENLYNTLQPPPEEHILGTDGNHMRFTH